MDAIGTRQVALKWVWELLEIARINNIAGEISCLKGLQGANGYPF